MTAIKPQHDHAEPGHLVVFSHPGAESRIARRETRQVVLPHFESPRPSRRP
ncbi:hypothetical protein ACQPW3_18870 [Actinosynnema sp. CA-248983]